MAEPLTSLETPREESATRALVVVFTVALLSAIVVTGTAVLLEPAREANRAAERDAFLRELVAGVPGVGELVHGTAGTLEARVVDLATGAHVPLDQEGAVTGGASAPGEEVDIPEELDLARLGRRPTRAVVYLLQRDGRLALIVLPVSGRGYGGVMRGYLALEGDADTVVSLTITDHDETPGIGSRVASARWLGLWEGKSVHGPGEVVRVRVADGPVDPESPEARHQVDAITGATRTGQGVTNMLRYWLGDHGFAPFFERLREEDRNP